LSHRHYVTVHDVFHILQQSIANVLVENLSLKNDHLEVNYKISVFWHISHTAPLYSIAGNQPCTKPWSALDISNYTESSKFGFKSYFLLAQHG